MLTLYILRHGKSDWDADYGHDRDRPLAVRGRKAAAATGRFLREREVEPEVLLTSPAVRARSTLNLVAEAASWTGEPVLEQRLYGASAGEVLEIVESHRGDAASLLVCGHEPWCSGVVAVLSGESLRFPTATVACLEVERLEPGGATLAWLQRPRELE